MIVSESSCVSPAVDLLLLLLLLPDKTANAIQLLQVSLLNIGCTSNHVSVLVVVMLGIPLWDRVSALAQTPLLDKATPTYLSQLDFIDHFQIIYQDNKLV